jgi:hypothetical protein
MISRATPPVVRSPGRAILLALTVLGQQIEIVENRTERRGGRCGHGRGFKAAKDQRSAMVSLGMANVTVGY